MNFGVKGYWNTNLGDDLFLKILSETFPEEKFHIVTYNNNHKVFEKYANIRILKMGNNYRLKIKNFLYKRAFGISYYDLYLTKFKNYLEIGGSLFMQDANNKVSADLLKRKKIRSKVKNYWVIGSNFGPYFFDQQIADYGNFFSTLNSVVFRDKNSKLLFSNSSNIEYAPDVVFNLNVQKYLNLETESYIVISVIDLMSKSEEPGSNSLSEYAEKYISKMQDIVKFYLRIGKKVCIMSFCDDQGDLNVARTIKKNLNNDGDITIHSHDNIEDSLQILAKSEKIITTRFHGLILSLILKKPVLIITYSNKTINVINDIDSSITYFSLDKLDHLEIDNIEEYFNTISQEKLNYLVERSNSQFSSLKSYISENSKGEKNV